MRRVCEQRRQIAEVLKRIATTNPSGTIRLLLAIVSDLKVVYGKVELDQLETPYWLYSKGFGIIGSDEG